MRRSLVLLIAAAVSRPALAQEVERRQREISVAEAVKLAVENNRELAIAFVDMKAADAGLLAAEGRFDWLLNLTGRYQHGIDPVEGFSTLDDGGGRLSISKPLPWSGEVSLELEGRVFVGRVDEPPDRVTEHIASTILAYRQPFLRGFGLDVAQGEIERAGLQRAIGSLMLRARAAVVLQQVETSCWELALALRNLDIRKSALELARKQLQITQKQIEVGRLTPVDALAVERAIAQREEELVAAEGRVIARSVELRQVIGLPVSDAEELLVAKEIPEPEAGSPVVEEVAQRVIEASPTITALKREEEQAAIEVRIASNATLPRLDLRLSGGTLGNSSSERPPFDPSYPQALRNMVTFEDVVVGAGLELELPFENRAARGALELAELRMKRARLARADLERKLRERVIVLLTELEIAVRRISLTKVATRFAQESLDAEEKRFQAGRSTNFFVLQRQDELREAQLRELRPIVDYLNARAGVDALSAEILDRHGVADVGAPSVLP